MKILILAGGSFIVPSLAGYLNTWKHEVAVFDNNDSVSPASRHITGDRRALTDHKADLGQEPYDVVIDMAATTLDEARQLADVFERPGQRIVLASSFEVYRAYGRHLKTEPGPPDLVPLLEDDPLREKPLVENTPSDLVDVEKFLRSSETLRETILRLPIVYGPNDPNHTFQEYLANMNGETASIALAPEFAEWRAPSGYVEDIGYAIALAAKNTKAVGKTYNVADSFAFTRLDWIRAIARADGWNGSVTVDKAAALPAQYDYSQHLILDSSGIRQDLGYIEQTPINEAFAKSVHWEQTYNR